MIQGCVYTLMLHFLHDYHKILVRKLDIEVVVLAVAMIYVSIAFDCGKDFRYIPAHEMCLSLVHHKSLTFLLSLENRKIHTNCLHPE